MCQLPVDKAEYLAVKGTMAANRKAVCCCRPSADPSTMLNGNLKRRSRDWGAYIANRREGRAAKSLLKGKPEQRGLSRRVGLCLAPARSAICTQRPGHDLIRLSLSVFVLLSLLCSVCFLSLSPLSFITVSALCSPLTLHFYRASP